ncbi:ATP-binding protein [Amycolatopsis anabasis]|uniref:ATP-binding protein n=1 Tax=Amycolatopsis anabasis TaxID=1840409 RepID=UPI00131BDBE5|nr:tetratricopeptide repeat protein [Amycolatopsis anabasis]
MLCCTERELTAVHVRYGILGSTLVSGAPVGPRQVRTVLAALLSMPNQPVTTETLAGELWSGTPPGTSDAVLQGRVSTLRKLLRPELPARSPDHVVRTRHGCYTLVLSEGELDAAEFLRLTDAGKRAAAQGDLGEASELLRSGLGLWRGAALQDTGRGPVLAGYAGMLEQRRLAALERRFEVDLALGEVTEVIGGLTEQLNRDATAENFAALLVEALVEAGRNREARDAFETTRAALEAAGIAPGARLCQARDRIRPELTVAARFPPAGPAQVPARLADFTGRGDLLERMHAALTGPGPRVVALSGPGGIGKSTLAVHAAHLVRREFADGQVVADLAGEPGQPAEVLRRFLLALGVAEESIPHGFVERQQLWRTRTADARVLVLLDDARGEAQVRALLPAGAGCGVLVTSRRRLLGLAGARTIPVEAFAEAEARQLLAAISGAERLAAEPAAARRLLRLCAGLPLAVRIVGAKLAARPHETVGELVTRIGEGRSRLAELRAGDLDVRATIEVSYAECTDQTRQALRLLGAVRLPAISRTGMARLLDVPARTGVEVAEALVEAQLLQVRGRDDFGEVRYQPHELIAEFAREKAEPEEARPALIRMLDFFTGAATEALSRPALWCTAEEDNVLAVVGGALQLGWWDRAWRLADAFAEVARVRPGSASARKVTVLAAWAARRSGDARAEATSLRRLGEMRWQQAQVASALRYLNAAVRRFRLLGDGDQLARTLITESDVLAETGRAGEARQRLAQALEIAADDRVRAAALDQLGGILHDAGEFAEAEVRFTEALRLYRTSGDRRGAIVARKRLADVLRRAGRYGRAAALLAEALTGARETGDAHWEAHVLRSLGEVRRYTGELDESRRNLERSLELFTEHGHRHAAAYSLRSLADLHAQLREYDQAAAALDRCREVFDALGDRRGQAYALRSLGGLCVRTGRWVQAEHALRAALDLFDALSMRWFSQDVEHALAQTRNWSSAS